MIGILLRLLRTIADRETRRFAIKLYNEKYDPYGEQRKEERRLERHRKYYHKKKTNEAD